DAKTGAILRKVKVSASGGISAMDVRTARAFVGNAAGRLLVLDTRTGAIVHTGTIGQPPSVSVVDGRSGLVFVALQSPTDQIGSYTAAGRVDILAGDSGMMLATAQVGIAPFA